jgi:phosphate transport system protein
MAITSLETTFYELNAQILQLGLMVDRALAQALNAFKMGDREEVVQVIQGDDEIDDLHLRIEQHTFRILSVQQPLYGQDLRFLTSAVPIALDLERIGDEAEEIAQHVRRLNPMLYDDSTDTFQKGFSGEDLLMQRMLELGEEVRSQVHNTMKAFEDRDAQAAHHLWAKDPFIDQHHFTIQRDLLALLEKQQQNSAFEHERSQVERIVYFLWIAHALARAGDHCTNICERIVFIVESETDINADFVLDQDQ